MQIKLDKKIVDLYGESLETNIGSDCATVLANMLAGNSLKGFSSAKCMTWAYELMKTKTMDVDKPDLEKLKTEIEKNETMFNLVKAQLQDALSAAHESGSQDK